MTVHFVRNKLQIIEQFIINIQYYIVQFYMYYPDSTLLAKKNCLLRTF